MQKGITLIWLDDDHMSALAAKPVHVAIESHSPARDIPKTARS